MIHIDFLAQDAAYRPANIRGLSWCLPPVRLAAPSLSGVVTTVRRWMQTAAAQALRLLQDATRTDLQVLELEEELLERAAVRHNRLCVLLNRRRRRVQRRQRSRDLLAAIT